ncbi:transcriptional regulator, partial [Bordetella bronchiseptica]
MSDSHTNPFVLPGMGQNSDLSGNPLLASMEMMRQAWAGLAGPGGLTQALPMAVPMNLEDLDRRINELRSVENWLRLNLSMLSSSIQGLEVQRATIATLRSFVDSVSSVGADEAAGGASPLEVALGLKPAPQGGGAPTGQAGGQAAAPAAEAGAVPPSINAAAQSASQAWWDLM